MTGDAPSTRSLAPSVLRGSYPPLITPFRAGVVDYERYEALVERQIAQGSQGIVVNGTTGAPSTLSIAERNELVRVAVRTANGRIQIVAATGGQSHADTLELTAYADKVEADAVLVVTPYFIRPSQEGLTEYYVDVGGRTERPVLIYHIPGRASVSVTTDTIERISARLPNLVGMKHAANDLGLVTEVLSRMGAEFRVFAGLEEMSFPMLAIGACGIMNAVGNLAPRILARLCAEVAAGHLAEARDIHDSLFELNRAVFFDTNPVPIQHMMKRMGLIENDEHRLPLLSASPELARRLDEVLRRAGANRIIA